MPPAARRRQLGRAALAVLGAHGSRGLTHRAVDRAAGLPAGSVNYHAGTRQQLLAAALDELFARDRERLHSVLPAGDGAATLPAAARWQGPEAFAGVLVSLVEVMTTGEGRADVVARHELLGEAQHRPELRSRFEAQREQFVLDAAAVLRAWPCPDPDRAADVLVALVDGLVSRQVLLGPGRLTRAELTEAVGAHLRAAVAGPGGRQAPGTSPGVAAPPGSA